MILIIIISILLLGSCHCQLNICFCPEGDLAISTNDSVGDIHADMVMPNSIVAYICLGKRPIQEDHILNFGGTFSVSVLMKDSEKPYEGEVKQFSANQYSYDLIQKWDPAYFEMSDAQSQNNVISGIPILRSVVIVQGLILSKQTGNNEVFLRLSIIYLDETYTADTKSFKVLDRIKGIEWVREPPNSVLANHPFDVALKIVGDNGQNITKFAFPLTLMLTAAYHHKYFFYGGPNADNLYATEARFNRFNTSINEVIISKLNNDDVVQKSTDEAQNGIITFKALSVIDPIRQIQLNATLVVPKSWYRVPFIFDDIKKCITTPVTTKDVPSSMKIIEPANNPEQQTYTYSSGCGNFLSKQFEVIAQTPVKLHVSKRYQNASQTLEVISNFPLPDINLEIIDNEGFPIYSGPDADAEYVVEAMYPQKKTKINKLPSLQNTKMTAEMKNSYHFKQNSKEEQNINNHSENNNKRSRKKLTKREKNEAQKRQVKQISKVGLGDERFFFRDGRAVYQGAFHDDPSFQRDPNNIQLSFRLKSKPDIAAQLERQVRIGNEINLAFFGNMDSIGTHSRPDPLIETFIQFAIDDLNERNPQLAHLLPNGFSLKLTTVNTKGNIAIAMKEFLKHIQQTNSQQQNRWKCIIGFGEEEITNQMVPIVNHYKIHVLGVRNYRFSGPNELYTSLTWDENVMYGAIAKMFVARNWKRIVLLYTNLNYNVESILMDYGIEISAYIHIPTIPGNKWRKPEALYRKMDAIAKSGSKIVLSFLTSPMNVFVFNAAYDKRVSGFHGYQWVSPHEAGLDFPVSNGYYLCTQKYKPTCTEMMQGFMIMGGINDLDYSSTLWQRVHQKFFLMDVNKIKVTQKAYDFQLASTYARGYDAVVVFANAVNEMVKASKTINPENLQTYLNTDQGVQGLTGFIRFSSSGRRRGFRGFVMTVYPGKARFDTKAALRKPRPKLRPEIVLQMIRYVKINENDEVIEVRHEANDFTKDYLGIGFDQRVKVHTLAIVALPRNAKTIPRKYKSLDGIIDDDLQIIEDGTEEEAFYKETVVMAYHCGIGCGGNTRDGINYVHGKCVAQNKCRCKKINELRGFNITEIDQRFWGMDAYAGKHCERFACHRCQKGNGNCTRPEHCECLPGHKGKYCEIPACGALGCGAGVCRGPMSCDCPDGFMGQHCGIVLPIVLGPILFAGALLLCCLQNIFSNYRERQKMHEMLLATDWLVRWEDIYAVTGSSDTDVTKTFKATVALSSEVALGKMSRENVGEWKGHVVFLEIFKAESLDLGKSEIRMQFVNLKQLNHPNLTVFVGACIKSPNVSLLTEYYQKGSLQNVLSSREIPLDWDVKFSFLTDIAKGMEYLHASVIESHGRLKSTNCLIDNRWGVRISGFGVRCMRDSGRIEDNDSRIAETLLWTAPELLQKHPHLESVGAGTRAGDVYSFSIILGEMITEERPYNNLRSLVSPEEIIMLLKRPRDPANRGLKGTWIEMGGNKDELPRPIINEERFPEDPLARKGLHTMMRDCWEEDPADRPSFRDITTNFLAMRPVKGDLVDLLIRRLEKHSTKLEEKFVEASKELQAEKKKVEEILSRMLPRKIVEDLIHGRKLDAEEFENVTIGFCDIADFVSMTRKATPFQVIQLLNDLFSKFDSIIEAFDVYKVETVRDEYMISSGLPVRNGFLHASEVATCALHLMAAMTSFEIKFMPGRLLMLRFGIHTGPCVAGVVGYHMPRYCLFGDTINTASRMKSSSSALRIHLSEDCFNVLKILGGFKTTYRGQREVKGRGKMHTYWLTGKTDFTKLLPDISLAVDESEQYFK